MINIIDILKEEKQTTPSFQDFSETRQKGAEKIAKSAKEKGGFAMLTYNHFQVKLSYYEKAKKGKFDPIAGKKEYNDLLSELVKTTKSKEFKLTQTEFQKLVGKLEVLGELIIKSKDNK